MIDKLVVYPERMRANLDRFGGLIHSQRVLLALTQKGVSREDAYAIVQRHAMEVLAGKGDFHALLKKDRQVTRALPAPELAELFDLGYHVKHVDTIFRRVFGEEADAPTRRQGGERRRARRAPAVPRRSRRIR